MSKKDLLKELNWHYVQGSTIIARIAWKNGRMYTEFTKNNAVYEYQDFPEESYDKLVAIDNEQGPVTAVWRKMISGLDYERII